MSDPETRAILDSAEPAHATPTLRPRMLKLRDENGTTQRINIGKIVRWHPAPPSNDPGILVIHMDDGDRLRFPDPDGQVDEALCAAFFDVTAADLT